MNKLVMFTMVTKVNVQLGTFKIIVPPMISATICTASPTDLSCVVLVVLKPMSRIIMVENELTTPFGIALVMQILISLRLFASVNFARDLRCEDANEEQDSFRIRET